MTTPNLYRVVSHLDAPKCYLTLTLDEMCVASISLMLFVVTNHKLVAGLLGLFLYTSLKRLKNGRGPRFLMVLAYWYLPASVTTLFLSTLPPSHLRVWVA
jgi:conjugal transfer pilus assembly protein TraL